MTKISIRHMHLFDKETRKRARREIAGDMRRHKRRQKGGMKNTIKNNDLTNRRQTGDMETTRDDIRRRQETHTYRCVSLSPCPVSLSSLRKIKK